MKLTQLITIALLIFNLIFTGYIFLNFKVAEEVNKYKTEVNERLDIADATFQEIVNFISSQHPQQ